MSGQFNVTNPPIGYPGEKIGFLVSTASYSNDAGNVLQTTDIVPSSFTLTAQVMTVSVPASPTQSVQTYNIIINGVTSSYVSGATPTQANIAAGLLAAVSATWGAGSSIVLASGGTTNVVLTSGTAGQPFTATVSQSGGTATTIATTTANVGAGTVYSFSVSNANVSTTTVSYTCVLSDTLLSIRNGLINALRSLPLDGVVYGNPFGNNVRLVTAQPGLAFTATAGTNTSTAIIQANIATTFIPFGFAVIKKTGSGTSDKSCGLPTTTGQQLLGISARVLQAVDPIAAGNTQANLAAYPPLAPVSVVYRGRVLCVPEVAVAVGDPVYFRTAAGANGSNPGALGNVSDSASCDLATTARWMTSSAAGGLAEVEISIP